MKRRHLLATPVLLAVLASPAMAQQFPTQPITIVAGAGPGGATGNILRAITPDLQAQLGVPLIVDYKPGANGQVAGDIVAKSAPTGYRLLQTAAGHTVNPSLHSDMRYSPSKDLVPVAFVGYSRVVMAVSNAVPANNARDMAQWNNTANATTPAMYASGGSGSLSHLLAELFQRSAGTRFTHVPYKSGSAAVPDLISGRVSFLFDSVAQMSELHKGGKLKILAVTGETRWPSIPDVPTFKELGYPEAGASSWNTVFAPAGTPSDVIARLNKEINAALSSEKLKPILLAQGMEHVSMSPEEVRKFVDGEFDRWGGVVKAGNIKAD
jgi:tripartite-type tricarboxylate transporter receptor subunit TctC